MVVIDPGWPERVRFLLSRFDLTRADRTRRGFVLPHPGREDNHPSVWLTVGQDGALLLKDRTGRPTLDILMALGMEWRDLYPADDGERLELAEFARGLGGPSAAPAAPEDPAVYALRHAVYSAVLDGLALSDGHRRQLADRGLPPDVIDRNGYRTLRVIDRGRVARLVDRAFGGVAAAVPGFAVKDGRFVLPPLAGLLIPVRDLDGTVRALKVRSDGVGPRYAWLGSGRGVVCCHFPLGFPADAATVVLTEGELKADVATVRHGLDVVSVPGVGNWQLAVEAVRRLPARTVRLAFDRSADPARQAEVDGYTESLAVQLEQARYDVEDIEWDVTPA